LFVYILTNIIDAVATSSAAIAKKLGP